MNSRSTVLMVTTSDSLKFISVLLFSKMKFSNYYLKLLTLAITSIIVDSQTSTPAPTTELSTILWSLSPCQSAFWIPNTSSEFAQNWITYQYEGNPLSQFGECVFTLESDPNTRIEMVVEEVNLFGSGAMVPPPCLNLYNVRTNGSIVLLKKECSTVLSDNLLESVPTFTDINLAVISTTIRYGSFQLQARAVPQNLGTPSNVSTTTPTSSTIGNASTVPVTTSTSMNLLIKSIKAIRTTTTAKPTSVTTQNKASSTSSYRASSQSILESITPATASTRKMDQPKVIVKMVSELNVKPQQLPTN
ncbi:hypothetical protein V9T40_008690 [Parthenolecanium corni]|uniref:CUB domain-containing protein n=1 Tax=Parthenolecanium corni TaxID=536013 RepID=A0AAN9Y7F1_9HEMI